MGYRAVVVTVSAFASQARDVPGRRDRACPGSGGTANNAQVAFSLAGARFPCLPSLPRVVVAGSRVGSIIACRPPFAAVKGRAPALGFWINRNEGTGRLAATVRVTVQRQKSSSQ